MSADSKLQTSAVFGEIIETYEVSCKRFRLGFVDRMACTSCKERKNACLRNMKVTHSCRSLKDSAACRSDICANPSDMSTLSSTYNMYQTIRW